MVEKNEVIKLRKGNDTLTIELLPDGNFKIIADGISSPNHTNAEGLIAALAREAGGEKRTVKRAEAFKHEHAHEHEHDGVKHSH